MWQHVATRAIKTSRRLLFASGCILFSACSSTHWPMPTAQVQALDHEHVEVQLEQLADCKTGPGQRVVLNPNQPLTLIVHGCRSSGGQYGALAQAFQKQGQQALCFNYDDRDSITRSSTQLRQTIESLMTQVGVHEISVIGHSQGGLVARRALTSGTSLDQVTQKQGDKLHLVTVSSPFGGIQAASHCGSKTLAVLSFGLTIPICQLVTGSKWREIPPGTHFINEPGDLMGAVVDHLKIVTDETGSCRTRSADGDCVKSDLVFSVAEQQQRVVDGSKVIDEQVVKAGHVEIVGDAQRIPYKLLDILQRKQILANSLPPEQFLAELSKIYDVDGWAQNGATVQGP